MPANTSRTGPGARGRAGRRTTLKPPRDLSTFRVRHYARSVLGQTSFVRIVGTFVLLWLLFAAALYFAERGSPSTPIDSYGDAVYWTVAAFSTAGIAPAPTTPLSQLVGAVWIIVGSVIFFGTIVATITSYFMRPIQRPVNQIVDTIEFNLERLDDLSIDELDLLKKTSDSLIVHMERLKTREQRRE